MPYFNPQIKNTSPGINYEYDYSVILKDAGFKNDGDDVDEGVTWHNYSKGNYEVRFAKYKGTDNINDGKIYIINMASSIKTKKDLSKALANNSAYKNCMEIDASKVNRKKMVEIVCQGNGKGGTSENNNKEYGGTYDRNGNIVELPPGKPGNPKENNAKLEFDGSAVFHGHASGSYTENAIDIFDPNAFGTISNNANVKEYFWDQAPSEADISNADETTHYVFGRRDGNVYIYNNTGLKSIMRMETFIHIND